MLAARIVRTTNDRDEVAEDFMRVGLMGKPKRRYVRERTAADEHDIRLRAIRDLKALGYHHDEIAVVASRTDRWVRKMVGEINDMDRARDDD